GGHSSASVSSKGKAPRAAGPRRAGGAIRCTSLTRPSHLVGLIRPVGVRPLADAEAEHSENEVPET
ncbi:MAG TPA: hypothetical protein VIK32_03335, partial [Candidatus Limnocylindrales bacterium]